MSTYSHPFSTDGRDRQRTYMVVAFAFLGLFYWVLAWFIEFQQMPNTVSGAWQSILAQYPLFDAFTPVVAVAAEMFSWRVLRHILPVLFGLIFAQTVVETLIQALYEQQDAGAAQRMLRRLLRGYSDEAVVLRRRHLLVDRQEQPILRWGGPGNVIIGENDVAVTEFNSRFRRVLGPGKHALGRYEIVRTVLDLREQEREQTGVQLITREGIEISADLYVRFRINRGGASASPDNPYPFDPHSVRQAAYAETVLADRSVQSWDALPVAFGVAQLRRTIADLRLDQLLDPIKRQSVDPHPTIRRDIRRYLRQQLRERGIELTDIRIGAFVLPPEVHQTFLAYWQAFHEAPRPAFPPTAEEEQAATERKRAQIREKMIRALADSMASAQAAPTALPVQAEGTLGRMLTILAEMFGPPTEAIVIPPESLPLRPAADSALPAPDDTDTSAEAN